MTENKQVQEAFDELDRSVLHLPEDMDARAVRKEVSALIQKTRVKLGDALHTQFLEKAQNLPVDPLVYAAMDIPVGSADKELIEEWEKAKSFSTVSLSGWKFKNTFPLTQYLSNLSIEKNLGFNLNNTTFDFNSSNLPTLLDAYFRVKYLTELPAENEARLPKTQKVQYFLREIYVEILNRIQSLISNNQADVRLNSSSFITNNDKRFAQELGLDLSALKSPEETLASRIDGIRSVLKDTKSYVNNPINKTNIDLMIEHAYGNVFERERNRVIESRKKTMDRAKIVGKGLFWGWTTKPVLNFTGSTAGKAKNWMKENKAETIGGLIGTAVFPGLGTVLGAGAARVFKKIAGK